MAKKTESIWQQQTLTGKRSMDWMKSGSTVEVSQIELGRVTDFDEEYQLPEWTVGSGKDIMVIHDLNGNKSPLLVSSAPVIRWVVAFIIEAESKGAKSTVKNGRAIVNFGEKDAPKWKFYKDEKAGQFAPYSVEQWEVV
jgi:hypothetical protein